MSHLKLAVVSLPLSFFAVSACTHQSELEASRTSEQAARESSAEPILVMIDSVDQIWIDNQVVNLRRAASQFERLHSASPDRPLVISADTSSTNAVVALMDAARASGIENVSIAVP
jgi:biopolymer transport protein ExbD